MILGHHSSATQAFRPEWSSAPLPQPGRRRGSWRGDVPSQTTEKDSLPVPAAPDGLEGRTAAHRGIHLSVEPPAPLSGGSDGIGEPFRRLHTSGDAGADQTSRHSSRRCYAGNGPTGCQDRVKIRGTGVRMTSRSPDPQWAALDAAGNLSRPQSPPHSGGCPGTGRKGHISPLTGSAPGMTWTS